jgi:hypothetical protein
MKTYKILTSGWLAGMEDKINELAEDGWVVKTVNVAFEGEDNSNENCYVVMELDEDDSDILSELQSINDKLNDILDSMPSSQNTSLDKVVSELQSINQTLEYIEGNTSN